MRPRAIGLSATVQTRPNSRSGPKVFRLAAGAKEIRTAGPILGFIDRGGRFETNTDGTALVDIDAFAGDPPHDPRQYRRHPSSLETLSALGLTDHAYDKLTGWPNVIPIVPVKGNATETYKF